MMAVGRGGLGDAKRGAQEVGRLLLAFLAMALVLAVLAGAAVLILTNTDWGRERVRRIAVSQLENTIHGRVRIGRLDGNLLRRFTIRGVAVTDSAGNPFVAVDSLRGEYTLRGLLRQRIEMDDVWLYRPVVVLDKKTGGRWNYQELFKRARKETPTDTIPGFGSWIRFTDARVVNGFMLVKSPWRPSEDKPPAEQREDVREALAGESRLVVVRAPGGTYQKVIELRDIDATLPLLRLADPSYAMRRVDVATLQMIAKPFHPPVALVRDLRGTFEFDGDSAWWVGARVRFPGSDVVADGRYIFEINDLALKGVGAPAALADLRWAYPRFPSSGGGRSNFDIRLTDTSSTYALTAVDITTGRSNLRGDLALTFVDVGPTDTLWIHDTKVRVRNLDTRLFEQLIPNLELPIRAALTGRATVDGGKHAMRLADSDISVHHVPTGTSRFIGGGVVGIRDADDALVARGLRLRLAPFQLPLLYTLMSSPRRTFDLPVKGVATGLVTIDGDTKRGGTVVADIVHVENGNRSALTGRASGWFGAVDRYDVALRAHPLSLATAGRFVPAAGLRGFASGPITVTGTLGDLRVDTDLAVAGGGAVTVAGRFDVDAAPFGYDLDVTARRLNLARVLDKGPSTSLSLTASGNGRGTDPATMRGAFAANIGPSRLDTMRVDSGIVRVRLANGLANVDRASVHASGAEAEVQGSFGLTGGHDGELAYRVAVADISTLHSFIPGTHPPREQTVRPRPAVIARRLRRAREDSARVARATEIERIVTGRQLPPMVVDTPSTVGADSLAGSLFLAGRIRGNVRRFDLRGRAGGEGMLVHGFGAERFRSEYAWTGARTAQSKLAVGLTADEVSARGFQFDTLDARVAYTAPTGQVQLVLRQGAERDYALRGDFAFHPSHNELHLADVTLRFDTVTWRLAQPAAVNWGGPGIVVDHFDLRNQGGGRLYAHGRIPTEGTASLEVAVEGFDLTQIVAITQSDVDAAGVFSAKGVLEGTLRAPRFRGAFGLANGSYGTTPIPELRATFAYANQSLTSHLLALRDPDGPAAATVDAVLPVNLALQGVTGDRLLPRDMRVDIDADSLPLDLAARVTDLVSNVSGTAVGRVSLRGRLRQPQLTGAIAVHNAAATVTATGARITSIDGAVRLLRDTVTIDSLAGDVGDGTIRLAGGIAVGDWRRPAFGLHVVANDAQILRNDRGDVHVDAGIDITGPMERVYVAGQVTVLHGVVYIPASNNRESISPGDPAIFAVLDTSVAADRELLPAESPLLANLRMDVDVQVNRNTWVRSRDANVEIFSDGLLHVHVEQEALALTGSIGTDRGEYRFFSKRFQVQRGSATFVGGPELNPNLQATAEYEARPPGREAVNIRVIIGGTLRRPRVSLESDAQPPIPSADLLSYLAFGREQASLLDVGGTTLGSGQGSTGLIGLGRTAANQLAAVALGVAVDEAEGEAARELGVDVLNVTPEPLPGGVDVPGFQSFLLGTRFEAGKYVNPRTFVVVQGSPSALQGGGNAAAGGGTRAPPGIRIEHRDSKGWRFQASAEPRFELRDPTLLRNAPPVSVTEVFGASIVREWRF